LSNNVRLVVAIALSLGVVLLFGYLTERSKTDKRPATADAAQVDALSAASAASAATTAPAVPSAVAPSVALPPGAGAAVVASATPGEQRERLENDRVRMSVSSRRGAIVEWKLKDTRFDEQVGGQSVPLDLAGVADGVLGVNCYDAADVQGGYADVCPTEYVLRREKDAIHMVSVPRPGARVAVRQTVTLGAPEDPYAVLRSFTIAPANPGEVVQNLVVWLFVAEPAPRNPSTGGFLTPKTGEQQGLCQIGGEVGRTSRGGLTESRGLGSIGWVGVDDTYFLAAFGFTKREPANRRDFCVLDIVGAELRKPLRATLQFAPMDLSVERTFSLAGHLGPKSLDMVRGAPYLPGLDDSIDYGWFSFLAVPMLRIMQFFHSLIPVWGLAIILLTVLVKLVMLPLTHWSTVSMRRMSALKPLMDEINEKYKDDKQRKNQAIMELYKTHKVNPLGGCFPILLQMPIWIALYRMLGASAELYHVQFLYLPDLTAKDPYYILPAILGISMFIQQKMTPTTADATQAKIMLFGMPIMFTVFMLFLPSGLNLYIFVNTVLSIAQQQVTNRLYPQPVLAAVKGGSAAPKSGAGGTAADGDAGGRSRRKR
jgi:YidC/Oxa1 family membrane protein insertase